MKNLIESLTIFMKYCGDAESPTHCEHDQLYFCAIKDHSIISKEDKKRLKKLGWNFGDKSEIYSFTYGSC
jgi:hypothetical protein